MSRGAASRGDLGFAAAARVAAAVILLGQALQISNGFYHPAALLLAVLSAICCTTALLPIPPRLRILDAERLVALVLLIGVFSQLATLAVSRPGFYLVDEAWPPPPIVYAALAAAAVAALSIYVDSQHAARWFLLALAACGALGLWMIHASPRPRVDVLTVYNAALYALRDGVSPYGISFTNIYGTEAYYPPGLAQGAEVNFGFPYPPLALLMALPGKALGDVRYADLAALLTGGACIARTSGGSLAPLAAMLLLFTPRTLFVIEQGWSEPFAICWLGALMLAASRERPVALPLGLLLAVKQHLAVALVFIRWLTRESRGPTAGLAARAIAVAAILTVPFVVWDPPGFWRSVVTLQLNERFRLDSLSVSAALARHGWVRMAWPVPSLIALGAFAVGCAIAWRRAPRTPAGFALSLGYSLLLLFLFSKKAFCNYYYLVIAALTASIAAVRPLPTGSAERDPRPASIPVPAAEYRGSA